MTTNNTNVVDYRYADNDDDFNSSMPEYNIDNDKGEPITLLIPSSSVTTTIGLFHHQRSSTNFLSHRHGTIINNPKSRRRYDTMTHATTVTTKTNNDEEEVQEQPKIHDNIRNSNRKLILSFFVSAITIIAVLNQVYHEHTNVLKRQSMTKLLSGSNDNELDFVPSLSKSKSNENKTDTNSIFVPPTPNTAGTLPKINNITTAIVEEEKSVDFDNTIEEKKYEFPNLRNDSVWDPFPRWDNKRTNGVTIPILLSFYLETLQNTSVTTIWPKERRRLYSELFYIMNGTGIFSSTRLHRRISKSIQNQRVKPIVQIMKKAHSHLLKYHKLVTKQQQSNNDTATTGKERWGRLRRVLFPDDDDNNDNRKSVAIPFFVFVGDYVDCGYQNLYQLRLHDKSTSLSTTMLYNVSIPIFTVAAIADSYDCNYSFPIPTYKTIIDSRSTNWTERFEYWSQQYPWEDKIPKAVWRGGLTGPLRNYTSPRWRLPYYVTNYQRTLSNNNNESILDVGLSKVPLRHKKELDNKEIDLSIVGGLVPGIHPMENFQQYRAILDIDGNSWSSRFGTLLCYNSVILKVDAKYVDYFYNNPSTNPLRPWIHYIPVQYDLSDLLKRTEYVLNPNNAQHVQSIIQSANEWCQHRMTTPSIMEDYLDIWEQYVFHLDRSDPAWEQHQIQNHEFYNTIHSNNDLVLL